MIDWLVGWDIVRSPFAFESETAQLIDDDKEKQNQTSLYSIIVSCVLF
jgi:hypothetical protein